LEVLRPQGFFIFRLATFLRFIKIISISAKTFRPDGTLYPEQPEKKSRRAKKGALACNIMLLYKKSSIAPLLAAFGAYLVAL
jgi:hypothetical protein